MKSPYTLLALLTLVIACNESPKSGADSKTTIGGDTPPRTANSGDTWINPKDGSILVYVPEGPFEMGASPWDSDADPEEKPPHSVYLDGFWIGKYPVTIQQFSKFVNSTGYKTDGQRQSSNEWRSDDDHPDNPVGSLSWNDAAAYCEWAGLRLPSEAEWEKAARGTDGRIYPWGNSRDERKFMTEAEMKVDPRSISAGLQSQIPPVTQFDKEGAGSPYGVFCMASHLLNWCLDFYDKQVYLSRVDTNPRNPICLTQTGDGVIVHDVFVGNRILRGGFGARATLRWFSWQGNDKGGFRVALGNGVSIPATDTVESVLQLSDRIGLYGYSVPVSVLTAAETPNWVEKVVRAQEYSALGLYRKALSLLDEAQKEDSAAQLVHQVRGDTYYLMAILHLLERRRFEIAETPAIIFSVDLQGRTLLLMAQTEYGKVEHESSEVLRLELKVGGGYIVPKVSLQHQEAIQKYLNSGGKGLLEISNQYEIGMLSMPISQLFIDESAPMKRLHKLGIIK